MKSHMFNHAGRKPFSCTQWTFSCSLTSNFKTQMLIHSWRKNTCSVSSPAQKLLNSRLTCCSTGRKAFHVWAVQLFWQRCRWAQTTQVHSFIQKKNHSGDKLCSCTWCNFSCRQSNTLKAHMGTHSGEKPFRCDKCNYSCIQAIQLKKHKLKKDGEKPISCYQCDLSFKYSSSMKYRMFLHTGEKPFVCKQCNYSCTKAGSLKRHMLIHSGEKPFNCT